MADEECRKLFEEIYVQNKQAARMNEHGDYVLPSIQDAWSGWLHCYLHLTHGKGDQPKS